MPSRTALVMADTRDPFPPPPSTDPRARLVWTPSYFHKALALVSMYARRHCYDLRLYRFSTSAARLALVASDRQACG